jgi:hypothetical protein
VKTLGPSSDDDPDVQIEIRAAEIARTYVEFGFLVSRPNGHRDIGDGAELAGWIERQFDSLKIPEQPGEWSGWLARVIYDHEAE